MTLLVAIALSRWGFLLPVNIEVIPGTDPSFHGTATADRWSDPSKCTIRIYPAFYDLLTPVQQQGVVTHEVGHCLGLDHVAYDSIMKDPTRWTEPQPEDLTALHELHPGTVRALYLPGIASD